MAGSTSELSRQLKALHFYFYGVFIVMAFFVFYIQDYEMALVAGLAVSVLMHQKSVRITHGILAGMSNQIAMISAGDSMTSNRLVRTVKVPPGSNEDDIAELINKELQDVMSTHSDHKSENKQEISRHDEK